MPWEYTEEGYTEYTRTTWNESAAAYSRFLKLLTPFRRALVERLAPIPGERILDLGTGPGEPALSIASHLGPSGRVVGIDLSERMIELAKSVALERKVTNIEFRTMDCTKLDFPSHHFDGATSNFGFQIFTNPEAAAREAQRVLRPNGRIALTVWPPGDRVPFLHVLIGPMLQHVEPDENGYIPTPYETGGPGEMVRFLSEAGFRDGTEEQVKCNVSLSDPEEYLGILLNATPLGHSLGEEPPEVQAEILRETREGLARYTTSTGLVLPAECVLVTARV